MTMDPNRLDLVWFVGATFLVTLGAGLAAFAVGGERTFESPRALPLLLIAIWAPNLVAMGLSAYRGTLGPLLEPLLAPGTLEAWVVALLPLAVAGTLALGTESRLQPLVEAVPWMSLVLMNLIMGPLGEELGWRGYLLPRLVPSLGWVGAALVLGAIWAVWHLPLWFVPSPHQSMSFAVFFATVVCFSVIMTAAWKAGDGALGPIVAFHLTANVAVGALEMAGVASGASAYRAALPVYACAALAAAAWLASTTRGVCPVLTPLEG